MSEGRNECDARVRGRVRVSVSVGVRVRFTRISCIKFSIKCKIQVFKRYLTGMEFTNIKVCVQYVCCMGKRYVTWGKCMLHGEKVCCNAVWGKGPVALE